MFTCLLQVDLLTTTHTNLSLYGMAYLICMHTRNDITSLFFKRVTLIIFIKGYPAVLLQSKYMIITDLTSLEMGLKPLA